MSFHQNLIDLSDSFNFLSSDPMLNLTGGGSRSSEQHYGHVPIFLFLEY